MTKRFQAWIVDDSPTEALITERSLGNDFDYQRFADGSIVVERLMAAAVLPDVLLLDWVMPGMAGDEVCRYLRSTPQTQHLPIILITTSRLETSDIVQGLASGANDYVARPFAVEELRARVDSAIRANELRKLAARERSRIDTINRLGRAVLAAGASTDSILDTLATTLTISLCDGCSIVLLPGVFSVTAVGHHRVDTSGALAAIASLADPAVHAFDNSAHARQMLPPAYHGYIAQLGLRGLAIIPLPTAGQLLGVVTLTRDGGSLPFELEDISTIETCIEYAALAIQTARQIEAERAMADERAEISKFQQQLLGIVGHDLRNPLAALTTGLSILDEVAKTTPMIGSVVRRLDSSTRRMTAIVDQLLDVTRARLGTGIPIEPREVQLLPLVTATIEELALAYPETSFELVQPVDVTGYWDPDRLSQVFSNLMSNAAQYGRKQAPILIAIEPSASSATISISNQNRDQPIPPEQLAALFDPYRRGRDERTNHSGLGLGLYIVHEIVTSHGGQITVESTDAGTVFHVVLPLTRQPQDS